MLAGHIDRVIESESRGAVIRGAVFIRPRNANPCVECEIAQAEGLRVFGRFGLRLDCSLIVVTHARDGSQLHQGSGAGLAAGFLGDRLKAARRNGEATDIDRAAHTKTLDHRLALRAEWRNGIRRLSSGRIGRREHGDYPQN